jgi:hypothetical protein
MPRVCREKPCLPAGPAGRSGRQAPEHLARHQRDAAVGADEALCVGHVYHWVRRDSVDDILAQRGDPVHRQNHLLALDAAYRFHPNLATFLRGQVGTNLFFNDTPVSCNISTSGSFGNRFSLVTLGLRASF